MEIYMRLFKSIAVVLALSVFGAAGILDPISESKTEVRDLSGFKGVSIANTITADISAGQDFKVVVDADEDVLPHVLTSVRNNSLIVEFERDWWKSLGRSDRKKKVHVTISLPELDDLDVSGASKASVTGVNSDTLKIDISGASAVSIDGTARSVNIDLSVASQLQAKQLFTESAEMDLSGASTVKINVSNRLSVDASGASSVVYSGSPRVTKATSGASSVSNN
jgi:hypothetical protein